MEKYLIILLILGLMYFVQTNTASSENFEGTSSSTIVDDWQAINALAQISADLMVNGGLKVPGKLDITGNLSATGTLAITGVATVGSLISTGAANINTLTATGAANVGSLKIGDAILTWDSAQKCLSSTNTIKTPTSAAADTLSTTGAANVGSLTANGSISSGNIKTIDNKTVTIPETNKNVIIYNHSNSGSGCSVDTSGNFTATNNLWIGNLSKYYTQTNTFDSAGLVVNIDSRDIKNNQNMWSGQPGISYSEVERIYPNIGFSGYGCNIDKNGNIFSTGKLMITDFSGGIGSFDKGYISGGYTIGSKSSNFSIGGGQLNMTDLSNGVIQLSPNNLRIGNAFFLKDSSNNFYTNSLIRTAVEAIGLNSNSYPNTTMSVNGLLRYQETVPYNVGGGAYWTKFVPPKKTATYYIYASRGPGSTYEGWVSATLHVFPNCTVGKNYKFFNYHTVWTQPLGAPYSSINDPNNVGINPGCFTIWGFGCAHGINDFANNRVVCLVLPNDTPNSPNGWEFIIQQIA